MAIRHFLSHLIKTDSPPLLPSSSSSSSSKLSSSSLFPAQPLLLHLHLPPRPPSFLLSPRPHPSTNNYASYSSASQGGAEEHTSEGGWTRGGGWEGGGGEMEGRRLENDKKRTSSSWTTLDGRRKLREFKHSKRPDESIPQEDCGSISTTTRGGTAARPLSRSTLPPPRLQPHSFQARPFPPTPLPPPQPIQAQPTPLPATIIPTASLLNLELKLTPPLSAHPDDPAPLLLLLPASLEKSIASLLSSPSISLEGLGISSEELSLALELLGSQTSSFTTLAMEEDSKLSLDEINELNKRREACARMVLGMVGERTGELLRVDEYWVARARLQLGPAVSTIPRSSYYFSEDGSISLHLPFFQNLLSPTSTRSKSLEAMHHFTNLLPRLPSLVQVGTPFLPRQDVLSLLDLILDRLQSLDDVVSTVDLIIRALTSRRAQGRDDQGVSFFVRRILQTFDGSSSSTELHSMDIYNKILDLDASSYLGSAAVCQFGLSLSNFWDAGRVLEDPQLSSRHFHLLAYRMVLSIERSLPSADVGLATFNVSRLARPFRRMGADPSRPRIPLSVDLRNRIVDLLSRHRDKSVAAWIFLNHPTIPVASSSSSSHTTIIDLETPNSLPPSPIEFAPLPLPLAEQLLLILCSRKRPEDLLLAASILQTIPPKDQTIKLYNLLLRHTFLTLHERQEADAFSSSLLHSLLIASHSNPSLRPNLQTLEAQLLAGPKSLVRKSNFRTSEAEHNELASFRRAVFDGFFALVMERGWEFRRRTWELLVGAVTKECGFDKGREAVEWMRLAGFETDEETTWGEQVLKNGNPWDRSIGPDVRLQAMVMELMDTEGVKHGRHIYAVLLNRVVYSDLGTPRNHLRHLFLTDFVARSFPGTSWITLTSSSSSPSAPSPPEPIIDVSHTILPARIHVGVTLTLILNPNQRPLPPHLLASFPSSSSSVYPSMSDLQPPSKWSDWDPPSDPPSSAGRFSFERDAAPMLSMLMNRFQRDADGEFAAIVTRCLQEGRTEEMRRREEEGLEWWEGGWEWEDEWREGKRTRENR